MSRFSPAVKQNSSALSWLLNRLQAGTVTRIKLIGDSITEGVGATNHTVPGGNPVIFTDGVGQTFREGDYTSRCWANFFREFITANYPTVQFINAGIGGKSTTWANTNRQNWISNNEDVVFVMLGTNDRQDGETLAQFETNISNFLAYVKARSKLMIVMSPTPTLNDYDAAGVRNPIYNFDMNAVDKVISKVCLVHSYPHISHYREVLEYVLMSKTTMGVLFQSFAVGSHPVDRGHLLMWKILQQQLGLLDSVVNWLDLSDKSIIQDANTISTTTPITSPIFGITAQFYFTNVGATHPDIANFPASGSPGMLITYRGLANDLYSWQKYIPRGATTEYMRTWDFAGTKWGNWELSSPSLYKIAAATITNATPITTFRNDHISASVIAQSHADIANFPTATAGSLYTYRLSENAAFGHQEYHVYQTNAVYKRYWLPANAWSAWTKISVV